MEPQGWVELANSPASIIDGTTLASSAAIGTISPNATTNPPVKIPADRLFPGAALRVTAAGRFSTTGTPTLNIGLYSGGSGGVALATSGAITTPSGVTNLPWFLSALIVCRTIGSAGGLFTEGMLLGVGSAPVPLPASAPAVVAVDTTTSKTLDVTATWGTSSASNTITLHLLAVEAMNFNMA